MIAAERRADLLADLRRMINNVKFSDEHFDCKDGEVVYVSEIFLMTRSDKLYRQLNTSMQNPVSNINSYTFLSILEVLHTGNMVQYLPFSSAKAKEIIQASKYLELPEVEKIVTEFHMRISALDVKEDTASAALKLSVALESETHADETLVKILSTIDLKPVHLRDLSVRAFQHYLEQTQSTTVPGSPSFREFIRFRQVLLWCVTQICPDEAAEVVAKAVLGAEPRRVDETDREKEYLKSILTRQPEHAVLKDRLLGLVDYRRIHVKLLKEVVRPLNVVPGGKVEDAYEFQALNQPPQYTWEHGSSYCIVKNNSVIPSIAKSKSGLGFARFSMPIHCDYGVYKWAIVVEEPSDYFYEIGFYKVDGLQESEFTGISQRGSSLIQSTGMALCTDGRKMTINQRGGRDVGWVPIEKHLTANSRVNFRLDMDRRFCHVSVDDSGDLLAWMDFPLSSVYYPAVSLGGGEKGRVRIELKNGF